MAYLAMAIWSIFMLYLTRKHGFSRHDYLHYLGQWKLVLQGVDPWSTTNAYGPIHNLLAFAMPLSELAPKFIMAGSLLIANLMLFHQLIKTRDLYSILVYTIVVITNFQVVTIAFVYGLNDALVAAFVTVAVISRYHGRTLISGIFLGLAVLLKYYPIFLVPLFALDNGKFKLDTILSAALVVALGLLGTFLVWGDAFLAPMVFGSSRPPGLLSLLLALKYHPSLIGQDATELLIRTNTLFVIGVGFLSTLIFFRLRVHWLEASIVGLLMILTTYKTNHPQFYTPWIFLVAALPLVGTESAKNLFRYCLPFIMFLSIFSLIYYFYMGTLIFQVVRQSVGFLAFALSATAISASFFNFYRQHTRAEAQLSA